MVIPLIFFAAVTSGSYGFFDFDNGYGYIENILGETLSHSDTTAVVETRWIAQRLDHFNEDNIELWKMRYFERLDMWKPGGPIVVFIGGEGEANPWFLKAGLAYEFANETNAAIYMSEHRYYGKSMPRNNSGPENLKYLSSRQALADLAFLIKSLKSHPHFLQSKVVVIGGSYPGNMAAWMRLLYTDLVDAAHASSAPVLAKLDFFEYLETVSDNYLIYGGTTCFAAIKERFQRYDKLLTSPRGIEDLKREAELCEQTNMTRPENQHLFMYGIVGYYMVNSQYGSPDKILLHCDKLEEERRNKREMESVNVWRDYLTIKSISLWREEERCWDVNFDEIIEEIRKGGTWLSSWVFQKCTEFSYAKTTSSENHPFSKKIPLETFFKLCSESFGNDFGSSNIAKSVERTNELYGGRMPDVRKVIFVNGDMDPWHRLSVLEDLSDEAPSLVVHQSSHCRDLLPNRGSDPDGLQDVRVKIKSILKSWIGIKDDSSIWK